MRLEDLQGRSLGRYIITGLLGRGGMAAVYRAHDTLLRRDVALKILYPQYTSDVTLVERFKREAVLAARLDHPNIVPIYDVGESDGLVYIAMKLLSGHALSDVLLSRGKLLLEELAPIVAQIASALDYAHARGIVHRDIKAGNILLEDGLDHVGGAGGAGAGDTRSLPADVRAILTDFGIAKSLDAPGMTGTGVLLGTPDYIAPEQIRGAQVVDGRADIYALGVLVFRCLTGRRPFEGGTDEVLLGHLQGRVADPSSIEPSLPAAVDPIIHTAMARDPDDRYPTAGAFARALHTVAGVEAPTPPPARRRDGEARVVVPRVAVEGLAQRRADDVTRKGMAAPPSGRTVPSVVMPPPLPRSGPRGSSAGGVMLAIVLLLLVGGGGLMLAQSLQRRDGATQFVAGATPARPTAETPRQPTAVIPPTAPAATAQPTDSPAPTGVVTSTQVTPSPDASPTTASSPTTAPSPTSPPPRSPTPTPCPESPLSGFGKLWNDRSVVRERLDCPITPEQHGDMAEQPFERGSMFWFQPREEIYVLNGTNSGTWRVFEEGSLRELPTPEPPSPPSPDVVAPVRGFGMIWGSYPEVRDALGWGTAPEAGPYAGAYQPFEGGTMLFSPTGLGRGKTIYVLYSDGTFERFDDRYVDPGS